MLKAWVFWAVVMCFGCAVCFAQSDDTYVVRGKICNNVLLKVPTGKICDTCREVQREIGDGSPCVVDYSKYKKVRFWTKISSSQDLNVVHIWQKSGTRGEMSGPPNELQDLLYDMVFGTMIDINVLGKAFKWNVKPSHGYRFSSEKSITPGEWVVTVVLEKEPSKILCKVPFSVR